MFHHVILLDFQPHLAEADALSLLAQLGRLRRDIPQIRDYRYGRNDSSQLGDPHYRYGLVMRFDTREDRLRYQSHPLHQAFVATRIAPLLRAALVLDFEDLAAMGHDNDQEKG